MAITGRWRAFAARRRGAVSIVRRGAAGASHSAGHVAYDMVELGFLRIGAECAHFCEMVVGH